MNTDIRPSATIYQFPLRSRRLGPTGPVDRLPARTLERAPVPATSGWYHEAAIQDEKPRKS